MDRFAFKIDKALKANLYKICRLCGIDNPDQVPILKEETNETTIDVDEEPEISQKIKDLIGFVVRKDDKMPQNICSLCMDKLNDFYEFREMCYATNLQTRRLLGLKLDDPKKTFIEVKAEIEIKEEKVATTSKKVTRKRKSDDDEYKVPDKKLSIDLRNLKSVSSLHQKMKVKHKNITIAKKTRSALREPKVERDDSQEESSNLKEEIKSETVSDATTGKDSSNSKLKELCNICNERFANRVKLQQHKRVTHIPNIPRYVCSTCNECYNKNSDIKTHQLWHKLSRTPYTCSLCKETMISAYVFARHLREHCPQQISSALLVLDRECPQCHKKFITNFFYNTHPCAVETKKCPGCKKKLKTEEEYLKHIPFCPKSYLIHSKFIKSNEGTVADAFIPIKNENDIEAAEAAASLGLSFDVTPVVSLTRLPVMSEALLANQCVRIPVDSPTPMESLADNRTSTPTSSKNKKHSKHSGTKEHIKRIDDLLKSTLDALVSIKHEPEVNMDTEIQTENKSLTETETPNAASDRQDQKDNIEHTDDDGDDDQNDNYDMDDFHNQDDDNDEEDDSENLKSKELGDSVFDSVPVTNATLSSATKDLNDLAFKVKEEPQDSPSHSNEKMPTLKLKIRKEHGKLNSSLIEGEEILKEKKKKKKKRKELEKEKDKDKEKMDKDKGTDDVPEELCGIKIKEEPLPRENLSHLVTNASVFSEPSVPVMTAIPMVQLQNSCAADDLSFIASNYHLRIREKEPEDIKPSRIELDRLLQITSVSSIPELPPETSISQVEDRNTKVEHEFSGEEDIEGNEETDIEGGSPRKKPRKNFPSSLDESSNISLPRIASVTTLAPLQDESLALSNVVIKTEPLDSGFSESISSSESILETIKDPQKESQNSIEQIVIKQEKFSEDELANDEVFAEQTNTNEQTDLAANSSKNTNLLISSLKSTCSEETFIDSIDFNTIQIKQEKEIDLFDTDAGDKASQVLSNGRKLSTKSKKRKTSTASIHSENGKNIKKSTSENESESSEDDNDDEDEEDDDDESEEDEPEEEEPREYREMEEPPLLNLSKDNGEDMQSTNDRVEEESSNTEPTLEESTTTGNEAVVKTELPLEELPTTCIESVVVKTEPLIESCQEIAEGSVPEQNKLTFQISNITSGFSTKSPEKPDCLVTSAAPPSLTDPSRLEIEDSSACAEDLVNVRSSTPNPPLPLESISEQNQESIDQEKPSQDFDVNLVKREKHFQETYEYEHNQPSYSAQERYPHPVAQSNKYSDYNQLAKDNPYLLPFLVPLLQHDRHEFEESPRHSESAPTAFYPNTCKNEYANFESHNPMSTTPLTYGPLNYEKPNIPLETYVHDNPTTSASTSLHLNYLECKESHLQARPFFNTSLNSTGNRMDSNVETHSINSSTTSQETLLSNLNLEEEQNIVNHEIALQQETEYLATSLNPGHPANRQNLGASSFGSSISNISSLNSSIDQNFHHRYHHYQQRDSFNLNSSQMNPEETENLLNERNAAAAAAGAGNSPTVLNLCTQSRLERSPIPLASEEHLTSYMQPVNPNYPNYNPNINTFNPNDLNEIAENHNNANIEKELEDETVEQTSLQFEQQQHQQQLDDQRQSQTQQIEQQSEQDLQQNDLQGKQSEGQTKQQTEQEIEQHSEQQTEQHGQQQMEQHSLLQMEQHSLLQMEQHGQQQMEQHSQLQMEQHGQQQPEQRTEEQNLQGELKGEQENKQSEQRGEQPSEQQGEQPSEQQGELPSEQQINQRNESQTDTNIKNQTEQQLQLQSELQTGTELIFQTSPMPVAANITDSPPEIINLYSRNENSPSLPPQTPPIETSLPSSSNQLEPSNGNHQTLEAPNLFVPNEAPLALITNIHRSEGDSNDNLPADQSNNST